MRVSDSSRSHVQVSDCKKLAEVTRFEQAYIQSQEKMSWPRIGVTAVKVGRATHPGTGDGWAAQLGRKREQ